MKHLHKIEKYFHGYVTAVALASGLFVALMSVSVAYPNIAFAATPFGGLVVAVVPEISAQGVVICPRHMTVINYANSGNLVGVYSSTGTKVYDYNNLYLPSKYLLGDHSLTPYVTCPMPYKVYQLSRVGTS